MGAQGSKHDREMLQKLEGRLEGEIVRNMEAVLLGLQRDTVIWNRGLFATPPVSSQTRIQ